MVRIKVLDWLSSPVHVPARFDVSRAVTPPLVVIGQSALGRESGIHISIPLHLVARASVTREHVFEVLVSEARADVAGRRVAGVGGEGREARGEEG